MKLREKLRPLWQRLPARARRPLLLGGPPLLALILIICSVWAVWRRCARGLPDVSWALNYRPPIVTQLWSGDDRLIGELYDERRIVVPYRKIPHRLVQAFVASEDAHFFEHGGIDLPGTLRAAIKTYLLRRPIQGGSTITQQTAKAILITTEGFEVATRKTIARKIREAIFARRLERALTKEQILEIYLNQVFLGHFAYGVEAAAENYFHRHVWDLDLAQEALIAGLPQAPSRYSPFLHPGAAKRRRSYVLRRMFENRMISAAERDAADREPVVVYPMEDAFREAAPYFAEEVRRDLARRYGEARLDRDGLRVDTTVDMEMERAAQTAALKGIVEVDERQGYQGPLMHLARGRWSWFRSREQQSHPQLVPGSVLAGLVVALDPRGQWAEVAIGDRLGRLPIDFARWARKPDPERSGASAHIDSLAGVLAPGDVVLVRISAPAPQDPSDGARLARAIIQAHGMALALAQEPKLQAALVSEDPRSGYVVAMVGGYDFARSEFNRATQACRQPGSSFKPIIYSAAIEQQKFTASTILVDAPIVTDDPTTNKRWKPNDFEQEFQGDVPVRRALIDSMNIPAIKTLMAVGVDKAIAWAHAMGIRTPLNHDLSIALGSSCVTLWDMTRAYSAFDRGGLKQRPQMIRKVSDRDGRTLEDHTAPDDPWTSLGERIESGYAALFRQPEPVMTPQTAFLITQLMTEVCRWGTGARAAALGFPVAGKTGTTNDFFDAWFMGFSRDLVTGVWVGHDDYDVPMDRDETGGHAALPIWMDFMGRALAGHPEGPFPPPPGIVWVPIDGRTGKAVAPGTPGAVLEAYLQGTEPKLAPGNQAPAPPAAESFIREGL